MQLSVISYQLSVIVISGAGEDEGAEGAGEDEGAGGAGGAGGAEGDGGGE